MRIRTDFLGFVASKFKHWFNVLSSSYQFIIMSQCQHGSSGHFLATHIYRPSLPGGLQGYILYRHRVVVYRSLLVVLHMLIHVKGSSGVCHLGVLPYFSSNVLHVWFVWLWKFSWWVARGRTAALLWGVASQTCSLLLAVFLCSCRPAFSPYV